MNKIEEKRFIKIDNPALAENRLYKVHNGYVLYCNKEWVQELGYDYDLLLGECIYVNGNITAKVIKVFRDKKYPNKRWWQFWIKQKEIVTGYHIMFI